VSGATTDISSSSLSCMIHQQYQNGLRKYQSMVSELTDSFPGILPGLSQMELPRLYMATHDKGAIIMLLWYRSVVVLVRVMWERGCYWWDGGWGSWWSQGPSNMTVIKEVVSSLVDAQSCVICIHIIYWHINTTAKILNIWQYQIKKWKVFTLAVNT